MNTRGPLRVATINVQASDSPAEQRRSLLGPLGSGVGLALLQEAKGLDVRATVDPLRYGVLQDMSDDAHAGSAVVWDRLRVRRVGFLGVRLAVAAPDGASMLDRYLIGGAFLADHCVLFRAFAGHRPPSRYRDLWPAFDRAVKDAANDDPRPALFGLDTNERDATTAQLGTGLAWRGLGVDGFLYSNRLSLGTPLRLGVTASDHRAVSCPLMTAHTGRI